MLREDLGFLRRVQALANKVKELRRSQMPQEPEHKLLRPDEDDEMSPEVGQQGHDEPMQNQEQAEELGQEKKQDQEKDQEHQLAEKGDASSGQKVTEEEKQ